MTKFRIAATVQEYGFEKKENSVSFDDIVEEGYSLESFQDRLRELCGEDLGRSGGNRQGCLQIETESSVVAAREAEILVESPETWDSFQETIGSEMHFGSEHAVEYDPVTGLMVKITIPKGFGFVPSFHRFSSLNLPSGKPGRKTKEIQLVRGTPMEYLERWRLANEVFEDQVRIGSIIRWSDGKISFCILQPHYEGEPASFLEIEEYLVTSGWTLLRDPAYEHELYFNYAFEVLAVDAMPRNCYANSNGLQPFDVILARPNEDLESYLSIYPDS